MGRGSGASFTLPNAPELKRKGYLGGKTKLTLTLVGFGFFHQNPNPQQEHAKLITCQTRPEVIGLLQLP
jgi:hypothetical protein